MNPISWVVATCFFWLSVSATSVYAQSAAADPIDRTAQLEALQASVAGTPYSALVIHTKVEITPLLDPSSSPKKGGNDGPGEERHTYFARVLETFKGRVFATIRYEMVVEKGESAVFDSKPQLLTLCKGPRGFYWPGVGSSFLGESEMVAAARRVAKQPPTRAKASERSLCD